MRNSVIIFAFTNLILATSINAQNVGIGTTKPDKKLTVSGTIKSALNSDFVNPQLLIHEESMDYGRINFTNTSSLQFFTLAGNPQSDSTLARLHIYNSDFGNIGSFTGHGRFGINASNPVATFHLNSQPNTDLLRIQNNGSTKFRIFSNDAIVFGSNWATPIPDVIRMETPHLFIGYDGDHIPEYKLEVDGGIKMNQFIMQQNVQKGRVLTTDKNGIGTWQDLPADGDIDPNNEIQSVSKSGTLVTLSDGGGSFKVDDMDPDPNNEIQSISISGTTVTLSHGGGNFKVDDLDPDPVNEIQKLIKDGNTISLSLGGGQFIDDDIDDDADPSNELQTLNILGSTLTISNGNSVSLNDASIIPEKISNPDQTATIATSPSTSSLIEIELDNTDAFYFRRNNTHPYIMLLDPGDNLAINEGYHTNIFEDAIGNISIGKSSYSRTISGDKNIVIGEHDVSEYSGDDNILIGNGITTTDKFRNVVLGTSAGQDMTGNSNVCIGHEAGRWGSGNNVHIGHRAGQSSNIQSFQNSVSIGYNAKIDQSNQIRLGNASIQEIGGYQPWSNLSDGRFKKNVKENIPGLTFINSLRPISYQISKSEVERFSRGENNFRDLDGEYKLALEQRSKKLESGFIAQEVEAAARAIGYDFDGVVAPQNKRDPYALAYSQFVVPLVKAVQELDDKNEKLEKENNELRSTLEVLLQEVNNIKSQLVKKEN